MKRPAYRIEYAAEAEEHLKALAAGDAAKVLDTVPRQLVHEPTMQTRNRKPLETKPRRALGAEDRTATGIL